MTSLVEKLLNLYGKAFTLLNNVWVRGHTFSRVLKASFSLTLEMSSTSINSTLDSFSRVPMHIVHRLDSPLHPFCKSCISLVVFLHFLYGHFVLLLHWLCQWGESSFEESSLGNFGPFYLRAYPYPLQWCLH
jgi:hypothetical protein